LGWTEADTVFWEPSTEIFLYGPASKRIAPQS
jgi:hypothetical protein